MAQIDGHESSIDLSCKDNSCLVCGDSQSQRSPKCNLFEKPTLQDSPDEDILEPHLWSMFVLTKVLHYPRDKCSEMLFKTCGSNPGEWFTLCQPCGTVVNNAYQLTRQMCKLEKQLQSLQRELVVKLENSFDTQQERDIDQFKLNVRLEIRNHFKPEEIIVPVKLEIEDTESLPSPLEAFDQCEEIAKPVTVPCEVPPGDNYPTRNQRSCRKNLTHHLESKFASVSSPKIVKRYKRKSLQTPARRPGRPLGSKTRHNKKFVDSEKRRKNRWLLSSDEDSDSAYPLKWKPIDRDLYQIYITLPRNNPNGDKIPCPICNYSYVNIRSHFRSHRARYAQFACTVCKYTARSQKSLNYHLTIRHKELGLKIIKKPKTEDSPQCYICKRTYSNDHKLREHLAFHRKYYDTECPICHFPCASEEKLEQHAKRFHSFSLANSSHVTKRRKSRKCHKCFTYYANEDALRDHMAKHSDVQFWNTTCSICTFPCESSQELENHLVSKHRPMIIADKQKTPCEKCDFEAETKEQLNQHQKTAHPIQINVYKCDRCDYVAKHAYILEAHAANHSILDNATVDELTGNYCCNLCSAEFDSGKSFIAHFSHAHKSEMGLNLFLCHHCDKSYAKERFLIRHLQVVHGDQESNDQRQFWCGVCGRGFGTESQFEEHKKLPHYNNRPAGRSVCDQCGMTFSSVGAMKHHVRKFHLVLSKANKSASAGSSGAVLSQKKCEHCGLTCVNLRAFKDHLKEAHPELYKFHCTLCPAKYISSCNLRLHIKSCHGQGKETCEWCGIQMKSYSMHEHLKKSCKQNPARNTNLQ